MRAVLVCLLAGGMMAAAGTFTFEKASVGHLPKTWKAGITGPGKAQWSVVADDSAASGHQVLKQSAEVASHSYPWCVVKDASITDGYVEVKFKPVSGREDQAGGLVWRWQNRNNYYVARANALENNVTIYHTIKGIRTEKGRAETKVTSNEWHTLRVDFNGPHFVVMFDGKQALEWEDTTFTKPGAVGVWTKADSVVLFDDFSYDGK